MIIEVKNWENYLEKLRTEYNIKFGPLGSYSWYGTVIISNDYKRDAQKNTQEVQKYRLNSLTPIPSGWDFYILGIEICFITSHSSNILLPVIP